MPTFTAQGAFSSTTLFPNSTTVNLTATETVSGSAEFQYRVVSASSTTILYGPSVAADSANTVYFYAASPTTNTAIVTLNVTGSNTSASSAVILRPGDWTYIPLHVNGANYTVTAVNSTTTGSILNVFYSEKSTQS